MNHSWVEISRSALIHNSTIIKQLIYPSHLAVVVKANAYGHGILEIAQIVDTIPDVHMICVAQVEEAVQLQKSGIKKTFLSLAYMPENCHDAIKNTIALALYNLHDAQRLHEAALLLDKQAVVHVKIDTGMSRLGIAPQEAVAFIQFVHKHFPRITIAGIFTHLGDKDQTDISFSEKQLALFDTMLAELHQAGIRIPLTHALSSGVLEYAHDKKYSLARCGTNIYGLWSSDNSKKRAQCIMPGLELLPVLSWKSRIIQIKDIPAGSSVGYGKTFIAANPMKIAVISIGYADGYPRALSNKGIVKIGNHYAPVIGIVSMNLTAVDITPVPDVCIGDHVTLLGPDTQISADALAQLTGTINIEITTRISSTIKRIVVD
ncbi:MAG: alanine racemase [Candidatus Babeliaceae bacterium]